MSSDSNAVGIVAAQQLSAGCHDLDKLLEALAASNEEVADGSFAKRVHAARKLGKSLRGGFAIVGLEKSAGRGVQAVGRLLSASRDSVSRRLTWHRLGWDDDSSATAAIISLLDQQMALIATPPPPAVITWCRERVASAAAEIDALDPGTLDECISNGLAKLDATIIKRCRRLDRRRENDFHEARKALKAQLGAITFLHGKSALDPLLVDLADLLGDENDLSTLRSWLIAHGFTSTFVPELMAKIDKRQEKLQIRAIQDASAIAKCT